MKEKNSKLVNNVDKEKSSSRKAFTLELFKINIY